MAKLKAAVILGGHFFDVPAFGDLLASLEGVAAYPQSLENWAADVAGARAGYDATVFYNMHLATPAGDSGQEGRLHDALLGLVEKDHGVTVLHHGLCAFREWSWWSTLVGIPDRTFRGYKVGQTMPMTVASEHSIVAGLSPFTLIDETYDMADAADGEVLLTTEAEACMKTIAWTREQGQARVFCYQSGHDRRVYDHPSFREILGRGIRWSVGV